jgi:hypothetical protein
VAKNEIKTISATARSEVWRIIVVPHNYTMKM